MDPSPKPEVRHVGSLRAPRKPSPARVLATSTLKPIHLPSPLVQPTPKEQP